MATDTDNQFAPPMWTDEQAPPPGFGDATMEASPSPMRPVSGSASGPSPADTPSPAKSAADEGFGTMHRPEPVELSPQGPPPSGKQQFHDTMADFGHRAEANRAAIMGLDPNDPDYTKKIAALQAQHGAITTEKARYQMLHPWGGPESAHPGVLGKIGHVAGTIGNVLGDAALGKGVTEEIPGSNANLQGLTAGGEAETEKAIGNQQKAALTKATEALAPERQATAELKGAQETNLENNPPHMKTLQEALTQAEESARKNGVKDVNSDPTVQQISDLIQSIQKPSPEKTPPHITAMGQDGKSHIMERDPATGQYSIDRGVAPPNYAQVLPETLGTKTTEMLGPDNVQHRYQFNPKTNAYDIDMGAAPTGQAAHQIFQAQAIEDLAPKVIADINANRDILGGLDSYYKQWTAGTPVSDPRAAQLMSELMSLAATQPALHAFRSSNAMESFEKLIGGLAKNPDATIASINGLMMTPRAFTGAAHKTATPASPTSPTSNGGKMSVADWLKSRRKAAAPTVGGP